MTTSTIDWPERIVFVVKATQGAIVNLAPMFHASLARIKGLIILCGVKDRESPTPAELREAIEPARRLEAWARDQLPLRSSDVLVWDGDPDRVAPWGAYANAAIGFSSRRAATTVFNLSGGRSEMTLGTLMGWPDGGPDRRLIHVGGEPLRVFGVVRGPDLIEEEPLPVDRHVELQARLRVYGVQPSPKGAPRDEIEGRFHRDFAAAAALHHRMSQDGRGAFGLLNGLIGDWKAGYPAVLASASRATDALQALLGGIDLPDAQLHGNELHIASDYGAKFLSGGWLEAHIFNLVLDEFANDRTYTIGSNLGLAFAGSPSDFGEFDVFIQKGDQLHLVEAKTLTTTKEQGIDKAIAKVAYLKRQLLGHQGQAWLVMPMLNATDLARGDFVRRAEEAGIRLLYNRRAVPKLIDELKQLP